MNLTVEWTSKHSMYKEPWKDLQEIPVIRVDALRTAIQELSDGYSGDFAAYRWALKDLLAQLPEE